MTTADLAPLPDTGERMVPELTDSGGFLDSVNRYRFACRFAQGRHVLDIACGEGYGAASMARAGAIQVIGMDIDPQAVEHAKQKYALDARVCGAEQIALADQSMDLIVSFETIEHLGNPLTFLREAARILRPGGQLIVSTPNKRLCSGTGHHNPFHLHELDESEFTHAVEDVFPKVEYYTQTPIISSLFSRRALASSHTRPRFRILSGLVFRLRKRLCSEFTRKLPAAYRSDPITAIVAHRPTFLDRLLDPSLVRAWRPGNGDVSLFFIALATR